MTRPGVHSLQRVSRQIHPTSSDSSTTFVPRPFKRKPIPVARHKILWEDHRALVINKPSNTAIQGAHSTTARKNWDALLADLQSRSESPELYPIHRLDKATTGTLLLAKSKLHAKRFSQALQSHQLERSYLAVTHGSIQPGFQATIEAALRVDDDLVRLATASDSSTAIEAVTRWKCLSSSERFSLIELQPATGRKHQLRVHCAEVLRAPIVGDHKYTLASLLEGLDDARKLLPPDTMLLHAHTLKFHTWDKTSGKRGDVVVTAPVPNAFTNFCHDHGLSVPE